MINRKFLVKTRKSFILRIESGGGGVDGGWAMSSNNNFSYFSYMYMYMYIFVSNDLSDIGHCFKVTI